MFLNVCHSYEKYAYASIIANSLLRTVSVHSVLFSSACCLLDECPVLFKICMCIACYVRNLNIIQVVVINVCVVS